MDLLDDETTTYVGIAFIILRNLKPLGLDAYRTKNNLPKKTKTV